MPDVEVVLCPFADPLAANRGNAQKSTGPRTAPGKERSAANLPQEPADFRPMSRGERLAFFAPRVPPVFAWLYDTDRERMAEAPDLVDLLR